MAILCARSALPTVEAVKTSPDPVLVVTAVLVLALLLAAWPRGHRSRPALVASWALTPGVLNPEVTQRTIGSTVCKRGWTRTIRPPVEYTNDLKLKQMRAYRVTGSPTRYQEDHLISLELGGHPTDPRNLWPEPRPRADEVDRIENELNAKVCSGELSLREAQLRESALKHRDG
jgi:hypothetical protein